MAPIKKMVVRTWLTLEPVVGGLTGVAIAIAVPILALHIAVRPAMPHYLLRKVAPGMTKAEVLDLLGKPKDRQGEYQWVYWRWGNAGWVEVFFDQNGTVDHVNDESAFP